VPWDANPRLPEVEGKCGCIDIGPDLERALKMRIRVCGIVELWKQEDRVQIGYGLSETQGKARKGTVSTTNTTDMERWNPIG
jgi:hypothetical protein